MNIKKNRSHSQVMPADMDVGGDADTSGLAQTITGDDVQAALVSDGPIAERRMQLTQMRSQLESRMRADRGAQFGPLVREIDDALGKIDSAGGETGTRSALGMDRDTRGDLRSPDDRSRD